AEPARGRRSMRPGLPLVLQKGLTLLPCPGDFSHASLPWKSQPARIFAMGRAARAPDISFSTMAKVIIENLVKIYQESKGPGFKAVNNIDLTVEDREFMVLVGPSGCGKSTTLRMIAGLEEITSGKISIDGRVINNVLPKDR